MKIVGSYQKNIRQLKDAEAPAKPDPTKAKSQESESAGRPDKVEISDLSRLAAKAEAVVEQTPDVRMERVEQIKGQVDAGQYKVDAEKVAQKIVDEHLSELL